MPSGTETSATKAELFVQAGTIGGAGGAEVPGAGAACVGVEVGGACDTAKVAAGTDPAEGETDTVIATGSLTTPDLLYARTMTVCVPGVAFQFWIRVNVPCPFSVGEGSRSTITPSTSNSTLTTPFGSVDVD